MHLVSKQNETLLREMREAKRLEAQRGGVEDERLKTRE